MTAPPSPAPGPRRRENLALLKEKPVASTFSAHDLAAKESSADFAVAPSMIHLGLLEPQIAPNTGNIARLCAATGTRLHLIGRLGFRLDDRSLRRAGLDFWPFLDLCRHSSLTDFQAALGSSRIVAFSARSGRNYTDIQYRDGDCLLFGSEAHGLPSGLVYQLHALPARIPMPSGKVRSLNLATAAGIALYEVLRQLQMW
jgi:tRNA (cytidine/uridine-2'-O-)-methyltransferase